MYIYLYMKKESTDGEGRYIKPAISKDLQLDSIATRDTARVRDSTVEGLGSSTRLPEYETV